MTIKYTEAEYTAALELARATTGMILLEGENREPRRVAATFNDGYSHWVIDDHEYVLVNGHDGKAGFSYHIFPEALEVLKSLPPSRLLERAWYPHIYGAWASSTSPNLETK